MAKKRKPSLRTRLRKACIRHYDRLIHDQPKEWPIRNFSQGATDYKFKKTLYGLEAESISGKRLTQKLEEEMVPLLGKSEDLLKLFELKKLDKSRKS